MIRGCWDVIDRLFEELDRLCERYAGEPKALEALDAVRYWAIEESVEAARDTD